MNEANKIIQQQQINKMVEAMNAYGKKVVDGKYEHTNFGDLRAEIRPIIAFEWEDEGCKSWIKGEKFPTRQCYARSKQTVHQFKRLIPTLLRTLKKHPIIGTLYLRFNYQHFIDFVHYGLGDAMYYEKKYYSQPVREIYRLIKNEKIRDIGCTILEQDDGYRYPFQDILSEINKLEFEKNPFKEIKRLWLIFEGRGNYASILKSKGIGLWQILWILRLNPKILKQVKDFVRELNINEIRLNEEDYYWCCQIDRGYDFKGISYPIRKKYYEDIKNS